MQHVGSAPQVGSGLHATRSVGSDMAQRARESAERHAEQRHHHAAQTVQARFRGKKSRRETLQRLKQGGAGPSTSRGVAPASKASSRRRSSELGANTLKVLAGLGGEDHTGLDEEDEDEHPMLLGTLRKQGTAKVMMMGSLRRAVPPPRLSAAPTPLAVECAA